MSEVAESVWQDWAGVGSPTWRCRGCTGTAYRAFAETLVHDDDCTAVGKPVYSVFDDPEYADYFAAAGVGDTP